MVKFDSVRKILHAQPSTEWAEVTMAATTTAKSNAWNRFILT